MATAQDRPEGSPGESAEVSRRVVIRGAVAFGLISAAGLPLGGCGDDSTNASAAAPATDLSSPSPDPARSIRPGSPKKPKSKSELYRRGPEPHPGRTAPPATAETAGPAAAETAAPEARAASTGEPTVVGRSGENPATARQGNSNGKGRPVATSGPTPAHLPPGAFARTSDIPVGGGRAYRDQKIVVTQPTAGQFQGFSATCTHEGCLVDKVAGGQIICPCHGSRFAIADGRVEKGPALLPLPAESIAVSSDGAISRR